MQQLIDRCAGEGALQIAEAFAHCGDADRAFEWLERAEIERDMRLMGCASVRELSRANLRFR